VNSAVLIWKKMSLEKSSNVLTIFSHSPQHCSVRQTSVNNVLSLMCMDPTQLSMLPCWISSVKVQGGDCSLSLESSSFANKKKTWRSLQVLSIIAKGIIDQFSPGKKTKKRFEIIKTRITNITLISKLIFFMCFILWVRLRALLWQSAQKRNQ